jgi:hypothetical protein
LPILAQELPYLSITLIYFLKRNDLPKNGLAHFSITEIESSNGIDLTPEKDAIIRFY